MQQARADAHQLDTTRTQFSTLPWLRLQTLRNLLASWSDDGPSRLQALQQENDRLRAALEEAQQVCQGQTACSSQSLILRCRLCKYVMFPPLAYLPGACTRV